MGHFFGGGSQTNTSSDTQTYGAPWQQNTFQGISQDGTNLYNQQTANGGNQYTGQMYNPINGMQQQASTTLYNGGTALSGATSGLLSQGANGINQFGGYLSGAQGLANGNFNQGQTSGGYTAANNIGNLANTLDQGTGGALSMASNPQGMTNSALSAGNQFANNAQAQGLIKSNTAQIANQLNNSTLPSLNAQAISAGGLNSSRAGAASAVATAQAQQNADSYAANVQNNAFNTGTSIGQQSNSNAIQGDLGAANAGAMGTYGAVMGESASNQQADMNNQLQMQGVGMLGNAASMGTGMLSDYGNQQSTAGQMQYGGGGILQNDGQQQDQANLQQWLMNQQMPWSTLNNYKNISGQAYGGSSTGTNTQSGSSNPLGGIVSLGSNIISGGTANYENIPKTSIFGQLGNIL